MKKKYGDVTPREIDPTAKEISIPGDGHSISYNDLSEIIRVRIEEMLRLIMLELPQSDYRKLIPAGLVITGGGANLPGIAELGQKVTRMPVRVGMPMRMHGVAEVLEDPAHATGTGLLMWKLRNKGAEEAPPVRKGVMHGLLRRMLRLFK